MKFKMLTSLCILIASNVATVNHAAAQGESQTINSIREECIAAHRLTVEGRFSEAEALSVKGYEYAKINLGLEESLTRYCLDVVARIYFGTQRYSEAIELFEAVLEQRLIELGITNDRTLETLHNLAVTHSFKGDYAEAIELFEKALIEYRRGDKSEELVLGTLNQIGVAHLELKQFDAANRYIEESIEKKNEFYGPEHPDTLSSIGNLALLRHRQSQNIEAYKLIKLVLPRYADTVTELHPDSISANVIAMMAAFHAQRDEATVHARNLLQLSRRRVHAEQTNANNALQRSATVSTTEATTSGVMSLTSLLHATGENAAGLAADAMLSMKGLGGEYDAALRRAAAEKGGESDALIAALQNFWPQMEAAERNGDSEQAKAIYALIGETELKLASQSPDFGLLLKAPEWEEVRDALPEGAVLLEYLMYRQRDFNTGKASDEIHIAAVLLHSEAEPVYEPLGTLNQELEDDIRVLTSLDKRGITTQMIRDASRSVYMRLVEPFDALVSEADRVYISPDDVLHRIPFDLLRTSSDRIWGLDQPLHLIPTGRVLTTEPSGTNDGRFIAIGGAEYGEVVTSAEGGRGGAFTRSDAVLVAEVSKMRGSSWGPLKGALEEVETLSKLFEVSSVFTGNVEAPLVGKDATEAAMRAVSGPPAILHLATHGGSTNVGFAGNPLSQTVLGFANVNRAGLEGSDSVENDGLMRGTDIAQLSLQGTRLVTLSACDTGDGVTLRGEGVMSLAHAFRLAGVDNVLMTYWSVDDDETLRFMKEFYSTWLDNLAANPEASLHGALRATKINWAANAEHPRYWSAFALVEN